MFVIFFSVSYELFTLILQYKLIFFTIKYYHTMYSETLSSFSAVKVKMFCVDARKQRFLLALYYANKFALQKLFYIIFSMSSISSWTKLCQMPREVSVLWSDHRKMYPMSEFLVRRVLQCQLSSKLRRSDLRSRNRSVQWLQERI